MKDEKQHKHCSECRFYAYEANTAHKVRCMSDGTSKPAVVERLETGACGPKGKLWRKK